MAIAPEIKNTNTLLKRFRDDLNTYAGITDFSQTSIARIMSNVFADQISEARNDALQSYYSQQLSRAKKEALTSLATDMGLTRFDQTFASTTSQEQNLCFYVESGTFGDLNTGSNIAIPIGSIIYSDANENELGSNIRYKTTATVTLNAGDAIKYISAQAEFSGSKHNVGPGVLRNHNFTNYSVGTGLKVVNFYSILNGRDVEDDEQLRFRLSKNYDRIASINTTNIQLLSIKVPGVLETKVIPGYFGIGTAAVIVLGAEYQSTAALVNSVQSRLNEIKAPGLYYIAVGAVESNIDFKLELKPSRVLTSTEKQKLQVELRKTIMDFFRSIPIGGNFTFESLKNSLGRVTKGLVKIGNDSNSISGFKNIYLRRGYANSVSSERETIVEDYFTLNSDEFVKLGTCEFSYI